MYKYILAFLFLSFAAYSQESLEIINYNSSNFPDVNAQIMAFDDNYQMIKSNSINDFIVRNNGINSQVISYNSIDSNLLDSLSIIIAFDKALNIFSGQNNFEFGKNIARNLFQRVDYYNLNIAITAYDTKNYLISDFSDNITVLNNSLNSITHSQGSFFDDGLIEDPIGAIRLSDYSDRETAIVVITDGTGNARTQDIIQAANERNIKIFPVVLGKPIPNPLKEISEQTSAYYFDNVTEDDNITSYLNVITAMSFGHLPCELSWLSEATCSDSNFTSVTLAPISESDSFNFVYEPDSKPTINALSDQSVPYLRFANVIPGTTSDPQDISLIALNSDIFVSDMSISDPRFQIIQGYQTNFTIKEGGFHDLRIQFTPNPGDSSLVFATLNIDSDACLGEEVFMIGGFPNKPPKEKTIDLTFPDECGLSFIVGDTIDVEWTGLLPDDVLLLEYSVDNGMSWDTLAKNVFNLKHEWIIPDRPSEECLVRVIQLWPNNVGSFIILNHNDDVNSGEFSFDGRKAVTSSDDSTVVIWNTSNGTKLHTLNKHTNQVLFAEFSPDGRYVVSASRDRSAILWDSETGDSIRTFSGHTDVVRSAKFSHNGDYIVTASSDGTTRIWNVESGELIKTLSTNSEFEVVWYSEFSTDDNRIVTCRNDGFVRIWDWQDETYIELDNRMGLSGNTIHATYNYDGTKIAATSSSQRKVYVWDIALQDTIYSVEHETEDGANSVINSASFHYTDENGEFLLTSAVDNARLWDGDNGNPIDPHILGQEHESSIVSSQFNFDASRIITASWDNTAIIYNPDQRDLQMDTSSCVFRIGYPEAESGEFFLGEVLLGDAKDTLLTNILSNNAKFAYEVNSIDLIGNDSQSFIIGNPDKAPFMIDSLDSAELELRFEPRRAGMNRAEVRFSIPGETLIADISGIGIEPGLVPLVEYIDFGSVVPGDFKDSLVTAIVVNNSPDIINIDSIFVSGIHRESFKIINPPGKTFINPGLGLDLNLRFSPSEIGLRNAQLNFVSDANNSPMIINLVGESFERNIDSIKIYLPEVTGVPGEEIKIPLLYEAINFEDFPEGLQNLNVTLRFNSTLLEPKFELNNSFIDENGVREINFNHTINREGDRLGELEFTVGLGNSMSTSLNIRDIYPNDDLVISILEEDGTFSLDDICLEGGLRLFDPTGRLLLKQNTPNPVINNTTIEFELLEPGFTNLYIVDILGKTVKTIAGSNMQKGTYVYLVDLSEVPNGSYNLILETPTGRLSRRLDINR